MRRREFITLLGGAAAAWPLAARAQQPERMRRIGVLMQFAADDPEAQARIAAFVQGLQRIGLDRLAAMCRSTIAGPRAMPSASQIRGGIGRARAGRHLGLLAAAAVAAVAAGDPHRADRVRAASPTRSAPALSRAWRGRAATPPASSSFEYGISGEMAGTAQRDRAERDASGGPSGSCHTAGIGQFAAIQAVAPSFGVELSPIDVRDAGEIERAVTAFARGSNGGLIVTASALAAVHRELIIALAARHKLPAVYLHRFFVTSGGLISYGPDPSTSTGARPATSIASSRARSLPTYRCRRRRSTSW